MRIFLVGFMGAGKSTLGRELAPLMNMQFVDLDQEIETRAGKGIPAIFAAEGEAHFRDLEKQMLHEVIEKDNIIVACGGGTPCYFDNMDVMNKSGVTIYIKMSTDALTERLQQDGSRPLINDLNNGELWQWIHTTLEDRETFYLQSQYKVKGKGLKASELAEFVRLFVLGEKAEA